MEISEKREDGRISKICMRDKCHQPIWVREYHEFSDESPLLCPECWEQVYAARDVLCAARNKDSYRDIKEIEKEVIKLILKKENSGMDNNRCFVQKDEVSENIVMCKNCNIDCLMAILHALGKSDIVILFRDENEK